jgi:hypothetical protein
MTHAHQSHVSDLVGPPLYALGSFLLSAGHWVQAIFAVLLGIASIVSAGVAVVRLYWDFCDRRAQRRARRGSPRPTHDTARSPSGLL